MDWVLYGASRFGAVTRILAWWKSNLIIKMNSQTLFNGYGEWKSVACKAKVGDGAWACAGCSRVSSPHHDGDLHGKWADSFHQNHEMKARLSGGFQSTSLPLSMITGDKEAKPHPFYIDPLEPLQILSRNCRWGWLSYSTSPCPELWEQLTPLSWFSCMLWTCLILIFSFLQTRHGWTTSLLLPPNLTICPSPGPSRTSLTSHHPTSLPSRQTQVNILLWRD